MMGVIAFFAGLVIIGTVVDITINILNLDEVFSENFVQHFQGFSLYTNTIKLFHCPEPGAPGSLDCINGIRFGSDKRRFSCLKFVWCKILPVVQLSFCLFFRFLSMSWVLIGHGYSMWLQGIFLNNTWVRDETNQIH